MDWFPTNSSRFVNTKEQMTDSLTKGLFTVSRRTDVIQLIHMTQINLSKGISNVLFSCVAKRPSFRCRLSHAAVEARLELEHGRIDTFACLGMEMLLRITERGATPMLHFQDRPPHITCAHRRSMCSISCAFSTEGSQLRPPPPCGSTSPNTALCHRSAWAKAKNAISGFQHYQFKKAEDFLLTLVGSLLQLQHNDCLNFPHKFTDERITDNTGPRSIPSTAGSGRDTKLQNDPLNLTNLGATLDLRTTPVGQNEIDLLSPQKVSKIIFKKKKKQARSVVHV